MDFLSELTPHLDAALAFCIGILYNPIIKLITKVITVLSALLIVWEFISKRPKLGYGLASVGTIIGISFMVTGCSSRPPVSDVPLISNVSEVGVFGGSYCEHELNTIKSNLLENSECPSDNIFIVEECVIDGTTARHAYKMCVRQWKSDSLIINPYNGVR